MCWLYGGAKDVIAGQTPKMKGMDLDEAQASVELLAEEFAISKAKMQVGPVGGPARAPSLSRCEWFHCCRAQSSVPLAYLQPTYHNPRA